MYGLSFSQKENSYDNEEGSVYTPQLLIYL